MSHGKALDAGAYNGPGWRMYVGFSIGVAICNFFWGNAHDWFTEVYWYGWGLLTAYSYWRFK
jgi:hypothetical protein